MVTFFKNLFSWTFKGMVTLSLMKFVYAICLILSIIAIPLTFGLSILALLFIRIILESIIVFWKINENLQDVKNLLEKQNQSPKSEL